MRRSRIARSVGDARPTARGIAARASTLDRSASRRGRSRFAASVVVDQVDAQLVLSNRRSQLSRILSNTGCVSATEPLITCSTSAVAVCCSSASLVSLNRRTFSIAITAWSAKVWSRSTWCVGERPGSRRATTIAPIGYAVAQQRAPHHAAEAALARRRAASTDSASRSLDVGTGRPRRRSIARLGGAHPAAVGNAACSQPRRPWPRRRANAPRGASVVDALEDRRRRAATGGRDCAGDRVEHRLHVGRASCAMTLQDLGGRSLPLERLAWSR